MQRWRGILVGGVVLALTAAGTTGCASDENEASHDESDLAQPSGEKLESLELALTQAEQGPVAVSTAAEVWSATNAWQDTDTPSAREAGMAWPANSGLTWEEKYTRWVTSLKVVPTSDSESFEVSTPYGKKLRAPALECSELALFLRISFAAWYKLPFSISGYDARNKRTIFAGHFGFVGANGQPLASFPKFKIIAKDLEASFDGGEWPHDNKLASLRIGSDDENAFLSGSKKGAGAYFDELYLNKRLGYFMTYVLNYFGSMNLADSNNMTHVKAASLRAGDVLLQRHHRSGVGHTVQVLQVTRAANKKLDVVTGYGNMPRAEPLIERTGDTLFNFTDPAAGGPGTNDEGADYATLGGGLRRFKIAVKQGGRWVNVVSVKEQSNAIAPTDYQAIGARIGEWEKILNVGTLAEQKATALGRVQKWRDYLRAKPASCAARENREEAFYRLTLIQSSMDQVEYDVAAARINTELRKPEDYVFSMLDSNAAKTCCWNSTTPAMGDIVMRYMDKELAAAKAKGICVEPTVFRADGSGDGYEKYRAFAKSLGREADWLSWSEDEPCVARGSQNDVVLADQPKMCVR